MDKYEDLKILLCEKYGETIVRSMIKFINEKKERNTGRTEYEYHMVDVAWAILWSITDGSERNCEFLINNNDDNNNRALFLKCCEFYMSNVSLTKLIYIYSYYPVGST